MYVVHNSRRRTVLVNVCRASKRRMQSDGRPRRFLSFVVSRYHLRLFLDGKHLASSLQSGSRPSATATQGRSSTSGGYDVASGRRREATLELEASSGKAGAMLRKLSCGSAHDDVEQYRSRLIDKELRADRKRYRSTYRLLLLGKHPSYVRPHRVTATDGHPAIITWE